MKIPSFILLILLSIPGTLFAHPLDISSSTYTIQENEVRATTYFHTYEAERLLRNNKINLDTSEDYYKNSRLFEEYVRERAIVRNNGELCQIQNISLIRKEMYEIISEGLWVEYSFTCTHPIQTITIELQFFIEYELQTNRLNIYTLSNGVNNVTPIAYKVLNPLIQSYTHDLSNTKIEKLPDTDGDGIPDEEERIYRTNPLKIDTDGDYYTDYEEVTMGWNPINASPSPGQTKRDKMPDEILSLPSGIAQSKTADPYDARYIKQTNLLDTGFGNTELRDTLKAITEAFKNLSFSSFWYVFSLVVLLGFIHAIGPGHSKGFLVSYVLDREKGFWQWLVFVTIFSLVHLADIVLLFLVTKLFFSLYDPTEYMVIIQRVSIVILFFFSISIFIRSIRRLQNRNTQQEEKKKSLSGGIFLAFVAGLAPCSFGWSIFLVLFSMGKVAWILPLLLALAIGIWLCLFCVLIITLFFRDHLYTRFQTLPEYSSILSSSILIILSLYLSTLLF